MRDRLMQFFESGHLPPELAAISNRFADLAQWIERELPANPERSYALRWLLESKDCAVRAKLYREPEADDTGREPGH